MGAGITHVHHFLTQRNLSVVAAMWHRFSKQGDARVRSAGCFALTAALRYLTRMSKLGTAYYFHGGGGAINAGVLGTLYIPSFSAENSVLRTMNRRLPKLYRVLRYLGGQKTAAISTQSAGTLAQCPADSVDYIFVDPPFGGNLMYSELNYVWEAWLRAFTENTYEAVISKTQRKGLSNYQEVMEACFCTFRRILKPGRWMTVEFHNSQNRVWRAIQEALQRAGFVVADVRTFDKQQGTFNQVTASGAVKRDLIISAYKPNEGLEQRFALEAGTEEGAWDFLQYHLDRLPVPSLQDGQLEMLAERQDYLLYDRMVAFHVQRGASVPLSAAQVYAGLRERFSERDGMFFLPEQAAEYDRRRLQAAEVVQLPLIVTDEKSAIQWLRLQLEREPRTLGGLQPLFMREAQRAWEKNEQPVELRELLEENFLPDEQDRWYVPDPNKAHDLERLRERSLLREFRQYVGGKGRLKVFRKEAVMAGFRHAWRDKDYATIIQVARHLPSRVLQEDPALLMYYDNAVGRVEG
jgi:hypothetical protein